MHGGAGEPKEAANLSTAAAVLNDLRAVQPQDGLERAGCEYWEIGAEYSQEEMVRCLCLPSWLPARSLQTGAHHTFPVLGIHVTSSFTEYGPNTFLYKRQTSTCRTSARHWRVYHQCTAATRMPQLDTSPCRSYKPGNESSQPGICGGAGGHGG